MADIHLMLAGDITHADGQIADGMAVVDGTTGAAISTGSGGSFEYPDRILGVIADGAGGFVVFGLPMAGFGGMARYLDNGTLDMGFAVAIAGSFPSRAQGIYQVVQQGSGWLVLGSFTTINGVARNGFARLNADGSVDASWPSPNTGLPSFVAMQGTKAVLSADNTLYRLDGSGVDGTLTPAKIPLNAKYIHPLADGRLVITGEFTAIDSEQRNGIQRLLPSTAAADTAIPDLVLMDGGVRGVAPHSGGLLVYGTFTLGLGGALNRIVRLAPDKTVDASFVAPVINGEVWSALGLASGKVLIAGNFTSVGGVSRVYLAVLNANGSLDTGWVPPSLNGLVQHLRQHADGKIYIIGSPSGGFNMVGGVSKPAIARLNADGTHDASYAAPVPAAANGSTISYYTGVVSQSDGRTVLWGPHETIRGAAMKFIGRVDASGPTAGFVDLNPDNWSYGVSELAGGKIILAGGFTTIGGLSTYQRIARLNANGTLDTSYPATTLSGGPDTSGFGNRGIIELSSNRRLVYTTSSPYLYRLDANGEIDGTYTAPTMNGGVQYAVRQSSGKIVMVGDFTTVAGNTRTRMVRLNADGTYDSSWGDVALSNPGSGARLFVLADDSIVLINQTASYTIGGHSRTRLAKLSAAGVVDATWNPAPNLSVAKIKQQSSGKLIVAGQFTFIGGSAKNRLARLNADGTLDATFVGAADYAINDFLILADDSIVYAQNTTNKEMWKMDANGNLDMSFTFPVIPAATYCMAQLLDGTFLLGLSTGQVLRKAANGSALAWAGSAGGGAIVGMLPVAAGAAQILFGGFTSGGPLPNGRLTRINADGSLDGSYPGYSDNLSRVSINSSDELLLVHSNALRYKRTPAGVATQITGFVAGSNATMTMDGKVYQTRGAAPYDIMRLNADGTTDSGYGSINAMNVSEFAPDSQNNGIFVWGAAATNPVGIGGVSMAKVARLTANGSIDGTWVGGAYPPGLQSAEKVFDAGSGKLYIMAAWNGASGDRSVWRVTSTGARDNWVGGNTNPTAFIKGPADVDPADYSVVGRVGDGIVYEQVVKYNTSGAYVAGWSQASTGNRFYFKDGLSKRGKTKVLPDSRVLVTGHFTANATRENYLFNAAILDTSGVVVPGYSPRIASTNTEILDVRDGKHYFGSGVVATNTRTMQYVALRVADGSYSAGFSADPYHRSDLIGPAKQVRGVKMMPDGRAYVIGVFTAMADGINSGPNSYPSYSIARILPDGTADLGFANAKIEMEIGGSRIPGFIHAIDVQADGKVVVAGEFDWAQGTFSRPNLCRLNPDGTLDTLFFRELGGAAWAVAVRPDGKIWVGGEFTTVSGSSQRGIVLLNADGTVDASFADPAISTGMASRVNVLIPLPDGKVIAAGSYSTVNGVSSNGIRRFNADGTVDVSFVSGATGQFSAAARDSAGRIYAGGGSALYRLGPDGDGDMTWINPFVTGDVVSDVVIVPGIGVIVSGKFNLQGRSGVVMLGETGNVLPDIPARPLFYQDGSLATVSAASFVPTPPMAIFPRYFTGHGFEGEPMTAQFRTFGGVTPYSHTIYGALPAGMTQAGDSVTGTPTEGGVFWWRVMAVDANGQWKDHVARFKVLPANPPWHGLLGFNANVVRRDPNGGGPTTVAATNGVVVNAKRLPGGKILIFGTFTTVAGSTRNKVALLMPNGTLDPAFVGPAGAGDVPGFVEDATLLPSGKIMVCSSNLATPYAQTTTVGNAGYITRLNADGTLDSGFTWNPSAPIARAVRCWVDEAESALLFSVVPFGSIGVGTSPTIDWNHQACLLVRTDYSGVIDQPFLNAFNVSIGAGSVLTHWFTDNLHNTVDGLRGMGQFVGSSMVLTDRQNAAILDLHIDASGNYVVAGVFGRQNTSGTSFDSIGVSRIFKAGGHDRSFALPLQAPTYTFDGTEWPTRYMVGKLEANADGSYSIYGARFSRHGPSSENDTPPGFMVITANGALHGNPATWGTTAPSWELKEHLLKLPDGRPLVASRRMLVSTVAAGDAKRAFTDNVPDSTFTNTGVTERAILLDDLGRGDFTADGTFTYGIESEERDVFTADGTFYFFGGSPPVPPGPVEELDDGLLIGALLSDLPKYGLREGLRLASSGVSHFDGLVRVMDSIELGDALAVILRELLAEGFEFGATASANYKAMMAVADGLLLAGVATSQLEAMNIVAVTFAFAELLRAREIEGLTEGLELGDALANAVRLGAQLVEELLLEAADGPSVVFGASVRDGFKLGDAGTAILSAIELLQEGVNFTLHLNLDDGQYVAFVINTESKGTTQYQNYPFNSFARIGGRYFGMTPDGIRELEGPDDAGSPIAARFRLAMSRLGVGNLKRMVAAYLGYSSTGDLRLKTITIQPDGVKRADHYRLLAQPGAPREARVKIGQGLRSVYWGFEVEAIDGAAFAIDLIDMQPIVVEQRIQGQNGGNR